jgi:hypothetical protein
MEAIDYLQRSKLYRKLIHGPYGDFFARLCGTLVGRGFHQAVYVALTESVSRPDGLACR